MKTSNLTPITRDWEKQLLSEKGTRASELERMARLAAGPFHVLNTKMFRKNLKAFDDICKRFGVDAGIYFARKANKSSCWLSVVAAEGHCVDVASGEELIGALGAGVTSPNLIVTGAEKSQVLIELALRQRICIVADSPSELGRINSTAKLLKIENAPVLVRLLPVEQPESRFGSTMDEWLHVLRLISADHQYVVDCQGVSFHLNGYSAAQRIKQAHIAVDYLEQLRQAGWSAEVLDIGGGFSVQYCDAEEWQSFTRTVLDPRIGSEHFHAAKIPNATYPYSGTGRNGPDMLGEVLAGKSEKRNRCSPVSLAERLRTNNIRLIVEPGRALLDGCGVSVFPIQGIKRKDDYFILTVAGLSMSLSEQWKGSEFLPDMSVWESNADSNYRSAARDIEWSQIDSLHQIGFCVGGSSCMEYDMLTWRKVFSKKVPKIGDYLIYHNTAGYQMDKNESEFHQIRLPMRFVWEGGDSLPEIDRPVYQDLI